MRLHSKFRKAAALMLVLAVIWLAGCGNKVVYASPLIPQKTTVESAQNANGARFVFSLEEFTKRFNRTLASLNPGDKKSQLDPQKWETLSEQTVDDNGVNYGSYFYVSDTVTFTAAAESESGLLFNIGCGCPYQAAKDGDNEYHESVILTAALAVVTAGGYGIEDTDRIYGILEDMCRGDETASAEIPGLSIEITDDTALFILSACADKVSGA